MDQRREKHRAACSQRVENAARFSTLPMAMAMAMAMEA
jgi:hypothetical protein